MKCKLSEKCEFGNLCKDATRHDSLTVLGCSSFKTKKTMTEQEWLQTCTTEQLADVLWEQINGAFNSGYACCNLKQDKDYVGRYKRFKEWLKQPHTPKE